jgi:hypothetical protein
MKPSVALSLLTGLHLSAEPLPDFTLPDVNETSPQAGTEVSPRDYQHRVSVYYFGAAT